MLTPHTYALIGKNISYSFSRDYFAKKFKKEQITDAIYINFDIQTIDELPELILKTPSLGGMNVTIPYKEQILGYLTHKSNELELIGACNTIKVLPTGVLKGYNTDYIGFSESLKPLLKPHHTQALILGTGGAAKAVAFSLGQLGISYLFVSRKASSRAISYQQLDKVVMEQNPLIINTTPLGTYPNIKEAPPIPYHLITSEHLLYDLIYNPAETTFLSRGKLQGAIVKNGYEMLILQAEASWRIWNSI